MYESFKRTGNVTISLSEKDNIEEVKRGITVGVWFDYNKDNKQNKHKFQKQIPERLTIITP